MAYTIFFKRAWLVVAGVTVALVAWSQTPQNFQYQAVVRDRLGNLLNEQRVDCQVDLIKGAFDGPVVYSETHLAETNAYGVVFLEIGSGSTTDDFSAIDWGAESYFLRLWVNGDEVGTSQLLSVSSAGNSSGGILEPGNPGIPQMTGEQILNQERVTGKTIFNRDRNALQIYNGTNWIAFDGACWPPTPEADAGDHFLNTMDEVLTLKGNVPPPGSTGVWSVVDGDGGVFADSSDSKTSFSRDPFGSSTLRWTISNECGEKHDDLKVYSNHYIIGDVIYPVDEKMYWFQPPNSDPYIRLLTKDVKKDNPQLLKLHVKMGLNQIAGTYSWSPEDHAIVGTYDIGVTSNFAGMTFDWTSKGAQGSGLMVVEELSRDNYLVVFRAVLSIGIWDYNTGYFVETHQENLNFYYVGEIMHLPRF